MRGLDDPDFSADFPSNSVGRSALEHFISETTDPLIRGKALTRLSHIYRHTGSGSSGENCWVSAAKVAEEAVQQLQPLNAPLALAAALRASVVPFVTDRAPWARERLEEALRLSLEANDLSAIGWSHWALHMHESQSTFRLQDDAHAKEALKVWKQSGEADSIGFALSHEALVMQEGRPRIALFLEAAEIFEKGGSFESAGQTYQMALTFGDRLLSRKRQFDLIQIAIRCYRRTGSSYINGAILQKGWIKKRFRKQDEARARIR